MLIHQISQLTGRSAALLAKVLELMPIFQVAEFRNEPSYFANFPDKSTFSGSAARAENQPLARDAQRPAPAPVNQALYGRELAIDDLRIQDARILSSPDLLKNFSQNQLLSLMIQLFGEVENDLIQGTGLNNQMLGLFNFVKDAAAGGQTAALGFTGAEQAAMNYELGLKLDNIDDQDAFVELIMRKLVEVPGANAILVNSFLGARMTMIAKRKGMLGTTDTNFNVPIDTWAGRPLVILPGNAITQTETDGLNNDCTSLAIVRFSEALGVCYGTNSGFLFTDFPETDVQPNQIARLQLFTNLVVEKSNAFRRISRIRL
jgi:hypothetical protein